jgi:hypothetical protein
MEAAEQWQDREAEGLGVLGFLAPDSAPRPRPRPRDARARPENGRKRNDFDFLGLVLVLPCFKIYAFLKIN